KDEDGDPILEVVVKNDKPIGNLVVNKSVEINDDVDLSLVGIDDLSGIKFRLTAKEDIIDSADGSIIYIKDATVGEYNLSKDGKLTVNDLPLGVYELQEITTLDGLVLDGTKHEVKFEQTDLTTKVYTVTQDLVNKPTKVEISKKAVTGEDELVGAKMSLYDADGNKITEWISSEKSYMIEGLEVNKKYILKEDFAPLGYVQAKEISFVIENTNEIQKVEMIDTVTEVSKVDEQRNLLKGAKLQVFSTKTKQIVDEWISGQHIFDITDDMKQLLEVGEIVEDMFVNIEDDSSTLYRITPNTETNDYSLMLQSNGETAYYNMDINGDETTHLVRGLMQDTSYLLREVEAPIGYALSKEVVEFTVEDKDVSLSLENQITKVEISKQDITTQKELPGASLKVFDDENNLIDEWISSTEPHLIKGLEVGKEYRLVEVIAPDGYKIANDVTFKVEDTGEVQQVIMYDELMPIAKKVKTGDSTNVQGYIMFGFLTITGIVLILRYKKKEIDG
ncbi:SpaA isopeptide-forming pilin-related protein, partial [Thomasclavelia cocleata]